MNCSSEVPIWIVIPLLIAAPIVGAVIGMTLVNMIKYINTRMP